MDMSNNVSNEVWCKADTCEESKDFISDLPDPILVHILSFLPIKHAIHTLLLRRFGNLWRNIQVLDFQDNFHNFDDPDFRPYHDDGFVDLIRHVLNLHDSSVLDKLWLKFEFSTPCMKGLVIHDGNEDEFEWEKGTSDQLEKLIQYAISRKVKVLDLSLKQSTPVYEPKECCDLPDVLSSDYLTHLKLAAFNIMSCTTIDLKSLKVLLLDEVSLNDEIMRKVLIGCPFLEDLSLVDCYGLKVLFCKNPNLKKVMVTRYPDCFWFEQKKYPNICWLLREVGLCKTFSPCTWTILVFTIWNFMTEHCQSFEWKNIILKLSLTKWHHPGLSLLLRNSQSLETLTMHIYPSSSWADNFFKTPQAKWIEAYEFDMDKFWGSRRLPFPVLKPL